LVKEGYDYPKPEIKFELPKPTPKVEVKLVTETISSTYLPPVAETYLPPIVETTRRIITTTTRRPTTTTTRRTTTVSPSTRTNQGYDYNKPSERNFLKDEVVPITYLPPVVETTRRIITTTTRRPTTTTTRRTTTVSPSTRTNQGYDYNKPSERNFFKDEVVPVTYLPPFADTTRRTTTTKRPTTTVRITTTPLLRTSTKEGYDYPKPEVPFELPKPTERISVKTVELASTYLPPVVYTTTTTRRPITTTSTTTTTPRPSVYLPPEEPKGYFYDKPSIPFFY
jgi:hypothetical protein